MPPDLSQMPQSQLPQPGSPAGGWQGMQPGAIPGMPAMPGSVPAANPMGAQGPSDVLPNVMPGAGYPTPGAGVPAATPGFSMPQATPMGGQQPTAPGVPAGAAVPAGAPMGAQAAGVPQLAALNGASTNEVAVRAQQLVEQYANQPYQLAEAIKQLKAGYLADHYHITTNSAGH